MVRITRRPDVHDQRTVGVGRRCELGLDTLASTQAGSHRADTVAAAGRAGGMAGEPRMVDATIAGLADYVEGMRVFKQHQQVPTYFRGTIYRSDLPWYNVPMLLLATTPPAMLTLMGVGVIGLLGCVRPRSSDSAQPTSPVCSIAIWSLLHAIIFLALRASPFSPGNDSIRHFLPRMVFSRASPVLAGTFLNHCFGASVPISIDRTNS